MSMFMINESIVGNNNRNYYLLLYCYKGGAPGAVVNIVGSLREREVACSASDHQGSNFEFCVWGSVISFISTSSGGFPSPL